MDTDPALSLSRRYSDVGFRYTGYPEIDQFKPMTAADQVQAIERSNRATPTAPLSIWVRAPCVEPPVETPAGLGEGSKQMVNRLPAILREIRLLGSCVSEHRRVQQLHLGGFEPTRFGDAQLALLMREIESCLGFADASRRELSIDIDPRRVDAHRLGELVRMGFNRIHIGVIDFDRDVLAAIHRVQAPHRTQDLVQAARSHALRAVALTLNYGLPLQSPDSLSRTLDRVIECRPDQLEVCAYVPQAEAVEGAAGLSLPPRAVTDREIRLLQTATERLVAAGYIHIGMEQFALPDDELSIALEHGRLKIHARGYAAGPTLDLLGVGVAGLGHMDGVYSLNAHRLEDYETAVNAGLLPMRWGLVLSREDELRRYVIERILCAREVHYSLVRHRFGVDFREHFRLALIALAVPERDGLVRRMPDCLRVMPRGVPFLRSIARRFDAHHGGVGLPDKPVRPVQWS